jgi:hypothetical protein
MAAEQAGKHMVPQPNRRAILKRGMTMSSLPPARVPLVDLLEGSTLLSGVPAQSAAAVRTDAPAVVVPAKAAARAATKTTLSASTGTIGAPVSFTVTVRAAAAVGSPAGSVEITEHGHALATVPLSPVASTNAKYAFSQATYTLDQQPGGIYYYFGKQPVGATYLPAGPFTKSAGSATFTVAKPVYTALPDGVEIATAVPGSGPAIGTGQTASAFYTEYLAKNGKAVDYSVKDGDTTFPYTLGAGDVITGFDEGTVGMQVGETRVLLIPPAEGYGSTTNGAIPKNSTLLFVVTLESIS